jgi:hypothetical protein
MAFLSKYCLRLLKNASGHHLQWLAFKGSLLLLPDSWMTPLPAKLYALTQPPSLLANRGRLWTFDLDKSWVRGKYNYIRDIRRSHCQPFCARMSAQLEWVHTCTLLIKKHCLVKIFCLSCVCFQHRKVFNSNMAWDSLRIDQSGFQGIV